MITKAYLAGIILSITAMAPIASASQQQQIDAKKIMEKANYVAHYQGKDFRADVNLTIIMQGNPARKMQMKFVLLRRDEQPTAKDFAKNPEWKNNPELCCKGQCYYVRFPNSSNVSSMIFTFCQCFEKEDAKWVYIPCLDLVKRMCVLTRRTSFLGSNLFYEDIGGRNIHIDKHELVDTTDNFYKIKSTPKNPLSAEFAYYITWVHKNTFIPVKTEYFDKNGKKYREISVLQVQRIQGYNTITKLQVIDFEKNSKTILAYNNIKYDTGIPRDVFTERYLRNTPMKYLK